MPTHLRQRRGPAAVATCRRIVVPSERVGKQILKAVATRKLKGLLGASASTGPDSNLFDCPLDHYYPQSQISLFPPIWPPDGSTCSRNRREWNHRLRYARRCRGRVVVSRRMGRAVECGGRRRCRRCGERLTACCGRWDRRCCIWSRSISSLLGHDWPILIGVPSDDNSDDKDNDRSGHAESHDASHVPTSPSLGEGCRSDSRLVHRHVEG